MHRSTDGGPSWRVGGHPNAPHSQARGLRLGDDLRRALGVAQPVAIPVELATHVHAQPQAGGTLRGWHHRAQLRIAAVQRGDRARRGLAIADGVHASHVLSLSDRDRQHHVAEELCGRDRAISNTN